jgi:hypothetical protein
MRQVRFGSNLAAFSRIKVITPELSMREGHRQRTKAVEPMPLGSVTTMSVWLLLHREQTSR